MVELVEVSWPLGWGRLALVLTGVVVVLLVFALYMMLGGSTQMRRHLRDGSGPRFLDERVPQLLRWDPAEALRDMSSLCRRRRMGSALGGGWAHCRGTVASRADRHMAWLAYTADSHARCGTLELRTSSSTLRVEVTPTGAGTRGRVASIVVDGGPLGTCTLETGELRDPQGQICGRYAGGRTLLMPGMTDYRRVTIGLRLIGEVNTEFFSPFERLGTMPPALRLHHADLSAHERWWLVGLLAIALFSDCAEASRAW